MEKHKNEEKTISREEVKKIVQAYLYNNCKSVDSFDVNKALKIYINKKDVDFD
ncbi:hypothetical protein [Clostridium grantii]|uniref:Uncharacterized protein n=1 Tax=Clostridium grantii DSM 8605 TaxID=1121316 RepID=A0A1M5XWB9_9CLOT|nr:hypothetical protein [Clostridium grantii]SHI04012.1 hypothetical protein SAMN02745207_03981 [Clostridium grantii DSM 8605]